MVPEGFRVPGSREPALGRGAEEYFTASGCSGLNHGVGVVQGLGLSRALGVGVFWGMMDAS